MNKINYSTGQVINPGYIGPAVSPPVKIMPPTLSTPPTKPPVNEGGVTDININGIQDFISNHPMLSGIAIGFVVGKVL